MKKTAGKQEFTKALVIFAIIAAIPLFLKNNNYRTLSCQAMIYAIVALGLNFIVGLSGIMTLGTAAVFGLGGYTTALLTTKLGIDPWITILPVIAIGWLIGKGLGYPSLRLAGVYLSLVTIGFNTIVQNLLMNLEFTGSGTGIRGIPNFSIFGFEIDSTLQKFYFIYVVLIIFALIAWRIVQSKWGRAFTAISSNADALETCGISMAKVKITAFTLSTIFAALAGCVYACFYNYVAPTTYTQVLSTSFVMILIIGGLGNFWGCILGSFVVVFLPQVMRPLGDWYRLIYAFTMLIIVLFFPNGIAISLKGLISKLFAKFVGKGGEMRGDHT